MGHLYMMLSEISFSAFEPSSSEELKSIRVPDSDLHQCTGRKHAESTQKGPPPLGNRPPCCEATALNHHSTARLNAKALIIFHAVTAKTLN